MWVELPAGAPGLLSLYGVGPDTAALLLVAAGDHPGRLRSEAACSSWGGLARESAAATGAGLRTIRRPAQAPSPALLNLVT